MATIYQHGSFLFFVYVCITSLLCLVGLADTGIPTYLKNLFAVAFEVSLGAGVTLFVIDRLYAYRDREGLKQRLIREAGSRSHDIAISAVEWLAREGWLTGDDGLLKGADLREARLQGARLNGANLEGTNLYCADLREAELKRANLANADVFGTNLYRANLQEADLRGTKLDRANLKNAEIKEADLEGASLNTAILRETILGKSILRNTKMANADLHGAWLYETDFQGAELIQARGLKDAEYLKTAKWEDAELCFVALTGVDLTEANMKGVSLRGADLRKARLEGTNMQGADLSMVDLRDAILTGTNLQGTDLFGALLEGVAIRFEDSPITSHSGDDAAEGKIYHYPKTDLSGARLPDGSRFKDFVDFQRFTNKQDPKFEETEKAIKNIRRSNYIYDEDNEE